MWVVLRTSETLPTGPHDRKVVLSGQELLYLLVVTISKVRVMLIAQVNAQTLFGVADRPVGREDQSGRY